MSQFFVDATSSPPPPPPEVPTQFTADDATIAVPVANNLNVLSRDTSENNPNGIQTTADPNGSDNLYVELTNRLQGTGTTVGATTADLVTFDMGAAPATYFFYFDVAAFNSSVPSSAGFSTYTTLRTNGATATIIDDTDSINHRNFQLALANVMMAVSGNNAIFRVKGVAGLTVNWSVVGLYVRAT